MITIESTAEDYFNQIIQKEGDSDLNIRISVIDAGTPTAQCDLAFCPKGEQHSDDLEIQTNSFTLFVDKISEPFLKDAMISFENNEVGGELNIKAPSIFGECDEAAGLYSKVAAFIETEVNPALAAHRGMCRLIDITDENEVLLQFGGGCHGCGMVDMTLKHGIEKQLQENFPVIKSVKDVTDHATGDNPYFE